MWASHAPGQLAMVPASRLPAVMIIHVVAAVTAQAGFGRLDQPYARGCSVSFASGFPTPATVHVAPSFIAGIRKPICKSKVTSIDLGENGL
jgi:hypothetical protein